MAAAMHISMAENGRLVLPQEVRRALGVPKGGKLVVLLEGDRVVLTSMRSELSAVRDLIRSPRSAAESIDDDSQSAERDHADQQTRS